MRLGLVGRGPQAQRYLDPRNGGNLIDSQIPGRTEMHDYIDWLKRVDGVIVATHPARHWELVYGALNLGKAVLVEKPLALNAYDVGQLINLAEDNSVPLEVAHTNLWHEAFPRFQPPLVQPSHAFLRLTYSHHERDYSAWLDWGPHVCAMLEATGAQRTDYSFAKSDRRELRLEVSDGRTFTGRESYNHTPMWHMVNAFARGETFGYDFQRRVYGRLFEEASKHEQGH